MASFQFFLVLFSALFVKLAAAQQGPNWASLPFNPFELPLAVRSPYLNTWLPQGNNPPGPGQNWPEYWSNGISGWVVAVVVDGQAYEIQGGATGVGAFNGSVIQKSASFSPTNTSFNVQTGPMDVTLTFLSPIEPKDLLRQSLPFSYMYMTAESNDGKSHDVRMYSDISAEFLLEGPGLNVSWASNDDGTNIILSEQYVQPSAFGEIADHSLDAVEYYCYKRINGTTTSWQISSDVANRNAATNMSTSLNNTADAGERLLSDRWPVLGIQIDWGQITSTSEPAVFTLGLIRDPVIQYLLPNATVQMRSPYYRAFFANDTDALRFFMGDFERAKQTAEAFDTELLNAGSTISSEYADLLALTARQVISSIDITLARGSDGDWNFTDTLVFMKNFGAAGSDTPTSLIWTQSVNTVDTLFTAFPAFLYFNPELAGYLLVLLLKYQDSPVYTQHFAAKNIGSAYPNATADSINTSHPYGVEETSNMLIMILAYTQLSGNDTLINNHYGLLQKWCQYLGNNTLMPRDQHWADYVVMQNDPSTNNQTNLALKGIIAIAAMSEIATISGKNEDARSFNSTASSFIQTWKQNALSSSQVSYFYGDEDNTGLMYNLYADVLLGLDLVSSDVYSTLTTYYDNLISSNGGYGIALMSEVPDLTSVSAMMLSAATVINNATRNAMISQVHSYASSNFNNTAFGDYYNPTQGFITNENIAFDGHGINSPAVGSIFSLLVKGNVTVKGAGAQESSPHSKTGAIAGGVIGSITGLALIGGVFIFLRRRRRHQDARNANSDASILEPAGVGQGPAMHDMERSTIIEPFSYTGSQASTNDIYPLATKVSRLQSSQNETTTEDREVPAIMPGKSVAANSRTGVVSRNSAELLSGGSSNSRASNGQHTESGLSSPLMETAFNRDHALRDEVENLRREVQRIRYGGIEAASEAPPPSYRED